MSKKKRVIVDVPFTVSDDEFFFARELIRLAQTAKRYRVEDVCPGMKTFWFRIFKEIEQ